MAMYCKCMRSATHKSTGRTHFADDQFHERASANTDTRENDTHKEFQTQDMQTIHQDKQTASGQARDKSVSNNSCNMKICCVAGQQQGFNKVALIKIIECGTSTWCPKNNC